MQQHDKKPDTLVACPYGAGFHLNTHQAWSILKVFHAYQLILAAAFFILFATKVGPALFGQSDATLFYAVSLSNFAIVLFSSAIIHRVNYLSLVQFKIIVDIATLTLLMHASGGITSGLGILIAVSVAAGGLMAGGICTLAFAAIATFAILGEQVYADISNTFSTTAYTYASVLSTSFFAIALLAVVLTRRSEASEQVIQQQTEDIFALELLNSHIIEQLKSGIIVIDADYNILLRNTAACRLARSSLKLGKPLAEASLTCWRYLNHWLYSPEKNTATLAAEEESPRVRLQFRQLQNLGEKAYLVSLEDLSTIDQQVQQAKLASLGGLTANIAHEIRNPLGAISHAGQLLAESCSIQSEDKRLLDIIHQQSKRINGIVQSVLNLSRFQQTQIEPININTWLDEFEEEFINEFSLLESPFTITCKSEETYFNCDKHHLKQIVDNLCSNALKHGQHESTKFIIMINVGTHQDTQRTYLSISDKGNGINEEIAKRIFEPFFTTSKSGTGLGLYICKQLAELNQANLQYKTTHEGGSNFTLTFENTTH
jgi:two-component system sensor histidine kinase PilS (NtrC family)